MEWRSAPRSQFLLLALLVLLACYSLRFVDATKRGIVLPIVPAQANTFDAIILSGELADDSPRIISVAIFDENKFEAQSIAFQQIY
jgi:hypothetical protein